MKKVIVSAPGKLMLFGEHAVVYGKPCLVTAIDQRIYVKAEILEKEEFELQAPDVQVLSYKKPIGEVGRGDVTRGARFVEMAVRNFLDKIHLKKSPQPPLTKGEKKASLIKGGHKEVLIRENYLLSPSLLKRGQGRFIGGIKITTKSDFSTQFGLGSSSAVTVCTIKALSELFEVKLSKREIFDVAYKTILDIQGRGSGFDVAASVYGGTLYFVTGGKTIEQLAISSLPLIVGYSGVNADTVEILKRVKASFAKKGGCLSQIYNGIEDLVNRAKDALVEKDSQKLGALMNKNQEYLHELGVSSERLDRMTRAAFDAGAYGAKLSGAGGGDCMIALAAEGKRKDIEEAINKAGGEIIKVKTNAEGVRVEN